MTDHPKDHDAQIAALYAPKPVSNTGSAAAADHSNSYQKATVQDGIVVAIETGRQSITSSGDTAADAIRAASVPYLRAEHPQTRNAVSPDQITDDTILHFPQGQVTARDARAIGWLAPVAATSSQPQPTSGEPNRLSEAPKAEVHPDLATQRLADPATEQSLSELVNNLAGTDQMEAIRGIVENGEIDQQTLGRAATQLMIEPSQLQERLGPIIKGMEEQARAVMSEGGVNPDDVIAFGHQHRRNALNLAMHKQGSSRNISGYAALRADYLSSLGELYPERALAADLGNGLRAYKDQKGRILVNVPGVGEMLWKQAIQGFGSK